MRNSTIKSHSLTHQQIFSSPKSNQTSNTSQLHIEGKGMIIKRVFLSTTSTRAKLGWSSRKKTKVQMQHHCFYHTIFNLLPTASNTRLRQIKTGHNWDRFNIEVIIVYLMEHHAQNRQNTTQTNRRQAKECLPWLLFTYLTCHSFFP